MSSDAITPDALRALCASLADHALTTAEKASVLVTLSRCADAISRLYSMVRDAPSLPDELVSLSARATADWARVGSSRPARLRPPGVVYGGPVTQHTNGSSQGQIGLFVVPNRDLDDLRDPVDEQAANADFAVACVNWVRQLIAESQDD